MKKKINNRFILIAICSIIATTVVMTFFSFNQLKRQVFSDLQLVSEILIEEGSYENQTSNLRVTIIGSDGSVYYDSMAEASNLENHLDRPEVAEAFEKGTGKGERNSDTLSKSVFYYAVLLDSGRVLRVGKEAHSVVSVFLSTVPVIIFVAAILAVICLIVSHYLTASIVEPIDDMANNLDNPECENIYPELAPFVEKIRIQHEEILATANMRQEFTANVSHELKTPLTAISGYSELMESGLADENDVKHFSQEIRKNAGRLLSLINDILKLSQLDSASTSEITEMTDIAAMARESVEMLQVSANKRNVNLSYVGAESAMVKISKESAQELVFNLIENAIRYNKSYGNVWVRVDASEDSVVITVKDTGIGIPEIHQERIFERFYRVDKSRSKELGGTGLGLAIVKHICMLTDGKISLKSEPDKGTAISISWENKNL